LTAYIKSQISSIWKAEILNTLHENPLHLSKFGVLWPASHKGIVGPRFNKKLLRKKPLKSFEWLHLNKTDWCLQQHGKTALTANTATAFLHDFFGYRNARLRLWPPRYPDLTPSDFFLRGCLNQRVYTNNPKGLEVLKHNTERAVTDIDQQATLQAAKNTVKRVRAFLQEIGGHFQHLLKLHFSICLPDCLPHSYYL